MLAAGTVVSYFVFGFPAFLDLHFSILYPLLKQQLHVVLALNTLLVYFCFPLSVEFNSAAEWSTRVYLFSGIVGSPLFSIASSCSLIIYFRKGIHPLEILMSLTMLLQTSSRPLLSISQRCDSAISNDVPYSLLIRDCTLPLYVIKLLVLSTFVVHNWFYMSFRVC